MPLMAKVIRISCAKFHRNRLTTVQDIQDYASLILRHSVILLPTDPLQECDIPGTQAGTF